MSSWLAVALGGALGAVSRYGVNALIYPLFGARFPAGTLVVNVLGSVVMGVAYVLVIERGTLPPITREILMVGFLGAFTTFSAFSIDVLALWQNEQPLLAALYILSSLILCLAGAWLAIVLTRLI